MTGRRWSAEARGGGSVGPGRLLEHVDTGTSTTTSNSPRPRQRPGPPRPPPASRPLAANVPVTDQVRTQLVAGGRRTAEHPGLEFSGLAPGLTYYGLDKSTGIHWAGARLVAAPSSDPSNPTQAQVSTQDEGSYYVFQKPSGRPVDGLRRRQHRTRHRLPGHHPAGGAPGVGLAGRQLPTQRRLTGSPGRSGWTLGGPEGAGGGSVPGTRRR